MPSPSVVLTEGVRIINATEAKSAKARHWWGRTRRGWVGSPGLINAGKWAMGK